MDTTIVDLQLEHHTLLEELSQDDILTVYRGQRKSDQSPVIIKVVSPLLVADEFLVRRFKLVAQQTARLDHPNIVRTYEAEQEDGQLYLVQDFVRAPMLAQVLHTEGSFSPQRMQYIARQVASALDYAHQKSVTHGNLSARKIFLGPDDRVWVVDFGQTQALFGINVLKQGQPMNDPEILAPERVHGQGPSRHSDLYALGILCYQMLAGKPPFTGTASAILHAQAHIQPRPLYRLNPGISVAVSEVVGRMLSKGLELRYNTGAEFARALSVACTLPKNFPTHGFQPPSQPARRFSIRRLESILSAALLVFLFAAGLIWIGYFWGMNQQPRPAPAISTPASSPTATNPSSAAVLPTLDREEGNNFLSLVVTPTPAWPQTKLADTLPTPTYTPIGQRSPAPTPVPVVLTPTSPPTPAVVLKAAPVVQPAAMVQPAGPIIPEGKGLLVFHNPTGYDLVVDLTGPTSTSQLIPPNTRHEFALTPGRYQCMIHTLTGQWLASRVLNFDIPVGQIVEKDYYTDYTTQ